MKNPSDAEGIEQFSLCRFDGRRLSGAAADVVREILLEVFVDGSLVVTIACAGIHLRELAAGFARQEDLPRWYGASRVFLFPTQWDPWGVVANEACAAATSATPGQTFVCERWSPRRPISSPIVGRASRGLDGIVSAIGSKSIYLLTRFFFE